MAVSTNNSIPPALRRNPLLRLIAETQLHHQQESARLGDQETRLAALHKAVSLIATRQGMKALKPIPTKPINSKLSEKLVQKIRRVASGILQYLKQQIAAEHKDDIPNLSDSDMAALGAEIIKPQTDKPDDILASIISYCEAVDTGSSYFQATGLNADSVPTISKLREQLPHVLHLATWYQASSPELLQQMRSAKPEELLKNPVLVASMDLFHSIIFSYRFACPEDHSMAGLADSAECNALTSKLIAALENPHGKPAPELIQKLQDCLDSDTDINVEFSSILVRKTFENILRQVQQSSNVDKQKLEEILNSNLDALAKISGMAVQSTPKLATTVDPDLMKKAFEVVEAFVEMESIPRNRIKQSNDLGEYLKDEPDITNYINEHRLEMIETKLKMIRDSITVEEREEPRSQFVATSVLHDHALAKRDEAINGLKKLLPVIYALMTGSKLSSAEVESAWVDSFDDNRDADGKTKRERAMAKLDSLSKPSVLGLRSSLPLPLILVDLLYDYIFRDEDRDKAIEHLGTLVKLYQPV